MLYMVEMDLPHASREVEWNVWYESHIGKLLSVEGLSTAQRFRCLPPYPSPYIAIYSVPGPQFFESDAYRQKFGRTSAGEWQALMTNWHRNLYSGLDIAPEVREDQVLVITEVEASSPALKGLALTWLDNVGLDRTVGRRGISILPSAAAENIWVRTVGAVRAYKPISPHRKAGS